jgi:hypothetical protein
LQNPGIHREFLSFFYLERVSFIDTGGMNEEDRNLLKQPCPPLLISMSITEGVATRKSK